MNKLVKAIRNPEKILPYIMWRCRHWEVRKVMVDGKLFHRYKGELYPDYLNHGNAQGIIAEKAKAFCSGKGIDIGADQWPFPGATPVRNEEHQNAFKLDAFPDQSLDFVFSSHCLEHLDPWQKALGLWVTKLKIGGVLFLYLPHESNKMWRPGGPWVGNGHKWVPTHEAINPFLKEHGMEIVEFNPSHDDFWSFHIVAKRVR
jgi:SAM-dependent methyltransferase